jgi:hypothetical protein
LVNLADTFARGGALLLLGGGNPNAEFTKQIEPSEAVFAPRRNFNVIVAAQQ